MAVFESNSCHLRAVFIFCFHLKKTTVEAHRMLSSNYGKDALSERTCRECLNASKAVILMSATGMVVEKKYVEYSDLEALLTEKL